MYAGAARYAHGATELYASPLGAVGTLRQFFCYFATLLSKNGTYSHIISDHLHYFENGGAGYVNAFDSWDFIRGQEYDPIKVMVKPPIERLREKFDHRHYPMENLNEGQSVTRGTVTKDTWMRSRHAINTLFMKEEKDFPTAQCFASAFEFLDLNNSAEDWFLQIECFDPHEPFTAPERFKDAYKTGYKGKILDWPLYEKVTNSKEEVAEIRSNYAALVAMCDDYFGKLLDWFDRENAWEDTALILTTDHGFLLGEHDWWAKNKMPYYEEISHIPLIMYHPDMKAGGGTRVAELTQTTDLMPTILEIHGVKAPSEVTAHSLVPLLNNDGGQRKVAILGMFAGPICVTDGRYTYYRFPSDIRKPKLPAFTTMPAHLDRMFSVDELATAELVEPFAFTKGVPVLKYTLDMTNGETGSECVALWQGGSCLFDLDNDPKQERPIEDAAIVQRLTKLIIEQLEQHNAPTEIYPYYGLERNSDMDVSFLADAESPGNNPRKNLTK